MKRTQKKIGKRKSRQETMRSREKQKTLDKQAKMTTQGGKHTRKSSDNGRVQKKKKDIFVIKKLTTENVELSLGKKAETEMKKKG